MNYCENCGEELHKDDVFCQNCGAKVEQMTEAVNESSSESRSETKTEEKQSGQKEPRQNKRPERKPLTKKQKTMGGIILAVILVLIVGFGIGSTVYSEENQISNITDALISKEPEQIAGIVVTDDPNFEVTAENLTTFSNYLEENPNYLNELVRGLENYSSHDSFYIRQNGSKLGVFDAYELVMEPVYGDVYTNAEDVTITLNGEELLVSDSADFYKQVGPFAPGILNFTASGTVNNLPLTVEQEVTWVSDYNEVYLDLTGSYFGVYSDLESGEVFVDGESIGQLEDGYGEFGPVQINEGMELTVGQTFADGEEFMSEPIALTADEYYYDFYDLVLATEDDGFDLLNAMYSTREDLDDSYDGDVVSDFNDYFYPDSSAFTGQRETLLANAEANSNNDEIQNTYYDITEFEAERVGLNTLDVNYEVTYTTEYDYDLDREDGVRHYGVNATIIFEETNNPNADAVGYISEMGEKELLYEEGFLASNEEVAAEATENDQVNANATVTDFVNNLDNAVNSNNFSAISVYIDPESSFYDEQASFVSTTYDNGTSETLNSVDILATEIFDDSTAQVRTAEDFSVETNGTESQAVYEGVYTLRKVNGTYLITGLTIE